jgi:hypothetical protein
MKSPGRNVLFGSMKNTGGNWEDFCLLRLYGDGVIQLDKSFRVGADVSTMVSNKVDGAFPWRLPASFGSGANDAYVISRSRTERAA